MPYLGILGDYFGIAGTGAISVALAPLGAALTISGPKYFNQLSKDYAEREHMAPAGSWEATGYKVAKWAATSFGSLVGALGAVLFGLSIYLAIEILSLGMMMPFSIGAGVTATTILIKYVSKAQLEHVSLLVGAKKA